jgi:hypothetical protein
VEIWRASTWKSKEKGQIMGRWIVGIGGEWRWLSIVFNGRNVCGVEPSGFVMTVLVSCNLIFCIGDSSYGSEPAGSLYLCTQHTA